MPEPNIANGMNWKIDLSHSIGVPANIAAAATVTCNISNIGLRGAIGTS